MNLKTLKKLTSQCGLVLSPVELESMVADLTSIVAFVDRVHSIPTDDVIPLVHPSNTGSIHVPDEPETTKLPDLYHSEATEIVEHFYLVPKVIKP